MQRELLVGVLGGFLLPFALCGAQVKVCVVERADKAADAWAYTMAEPGVGWEATAFNDVAWKRSAGGFGSEGMRKNATVATPWTATKTLWLRKRFDLPAAVLGVARVMASVFHDEDVEMWLNGGKIAELNGYNHGYESYDLDAAKFRALAKEKGNVLAVKVYQTICDQYFDMGLDVFADAEGNLAGVTEKVVYLDELDMAKITSGDQMDWGQAKRKKKPFTRANVTAKRNANAFGEPLSINSNRFERGVGVIGNSLAVVEVGGKALWFDAVAGPDTTTLEHWRWGNDCWFQVWADDKVVYSSGFIGPRRSVKIHVDVKGAKRVYLQAYYSETHEFTPIDWCDARFTTLPDAELRTVSLPPAQQWGILTPPESPEPRINGPALFGVRPGHPILYTLPVSGEHPMTFTAEGLPDGATFDAERGFLRGSVVRAGTYPIRFTARNAKGQTERVVRLVVGDRIALTPPMCWNSWNCFARTIDEAKIRGVADAFVSSGLINHGWTYINLDDFWMQYARKSGWYTDDIMGPGRTAEGEIMSNQRFPDMKKLADYIHGKGLKFGLYSSPGPETCGGCYGSWEHEAQDAATYAKWGVDFLKYDWCSLGSVNDKTKPKAYQAQWPFKLMGDALKAQNRDIVFDICQYGGFSVWSWGAEVGGQMWRTTGDIMDIWGSCLDIIDHQIPITRYPKPGAWNDPDMMIVGDLGWGRGLRSSRITPNEQYTHVGLWAMLAAPFQIGCDIAGMNAFTKSLLTNDEILEINQDELGRSADCVEHTDAYDIWVKQMVDGSLAVALFNRFYEARDIKFMCNRHGIVDGWRVRDVWRQQDLGETKGWEWKVRDVPPHATVVLRFYPPRGV